MGLLYVLRVILVLLSIASLSVHAQEGATCTLPNSSTQSLCKRLHYCDAFWSKVISSGGKPSKADQDNIKLHVCGNNLVCCPDDAILVTSPPTVSIVTMRAADLNLPPKSNLEAVSKHPNFNLINDRKCGQSSSKRIVGGEEAEPGEFPWMALLRYKARLENSFSFNCGGSLISTRYVLTAAHCVNRDLVSIRLGEHQLDTEIDCDFENVCLDPVQDIDIETKVRHKFYNPVKKVNDIALLRLVTPADTSKRNVKTICLPMSAENQIDVLEKNAKEKMTIAGWGKVESGKQSNVLMKANVPFVTNSECFARFSKDGINVYDTYLCAGGKNKTDTCNGDSGGPIQTFGSIHDKIKTIQYGVVSVGVQCLVPEVIYPGIYTNLAYYLDWILDNIKV